MIYAILTCVLKLVIAFFLAVFLTSKIKTKNFLRSVVFFPNLISTVAVGITFSALMHPTKGLINQVLTTFGGTSVDWLGNTDIALYSVILTDVWKGVGVATVIFIAGMQSIDKTFYEAASIDGAGPVRRAISVVLPLAKEQLLVCSIITVIGAFKLFTEVYSTTAGGPGNSTQVLGLFLYQNAFLHDDLGMAAVTGVFIFVITMVLSVIQLKVSRSGEV